MSAKHSETTLHRVAQYARRFVSRRPWIVVFVVVLGLFTAIGSNSLAASRTEAVIPSAAPSSSNIGGAAAGNSSSGGAVNGNGIQLPQIFIHVVGAVVRPGLYELPTASRLADLIAMAGGFTSKAEQASVNLARVLTDGEQVFVLTRSQFVGSTPALGNSATGANSLGAKISLNRATESELESLPRVGPALAGRIIDWRTANGGFKAKEDLLKVAGFGDKMFAAIKDQVTL